MDPQEDGGLRIADCGLIQPRTGFIDYLRSWTFVRRLAVGRAAEAIAVDVEPAIEAELVIERERRDERGGLESSCVQLGRERRHICGEVHAVVARAVAGRITAGQKR